MIRAQKKPLSSQGLESEGENSQSLNLEPVVSQVFHRPLQDFFAQAEQVILGKPEQLKLALCTLLARGHLLIEDLPGVGKTTLVKLLAHSLGLKSSRIQFTNDLLPADIVGTSIYSPAKAEFSFHPGPIFAQLVIADELNRATPKTQSACLQAMEERKVTVDGGTYSLPDPFFVVATQNPREQMGTYPLPESQLDRFLMRIEMGYPDAEAERALLLGRRRELLLEELSVVIEPQLLLQMQEVVEHILVAEPIVDYIQKLLHRSRQLGGEVRGLSPRAGLALMRASRAWALLEGRAYVLPEDVQAIAVTVMSHRLNGGVHMGSQEGQILARQILESVSVD